MWHEVDVRHTMIPSAIQPDLASQARTAEFVSMGPHEARSSYTHVKRNYH